MDKINHPDHYRSKSMESIEVIEVMTENLSGFAGYCMGNVIKYLYRFEGKGGTEDLRKAGKYIEFLEEHIVEEKAKDLIWEIIDPNREQRDCVERSEQAPDPLESIRWSAGIIPDDVICPDCGRVCSPYEMVCPNCSEFLGGM